MDCTRWRELASDYIEGTLLSEEVATAMREHAAACASCRADEVSLRVLWREMNVLPDADPPLFFRENVMAAIERQEKETSSAGPFWRTFLPHLGRVAMGTALTGGTVAALAWMLLYPSLDMSANRANLPPVSAVLPGAPEPHTAKTTGAADLRIARITTAVPEVGPAYDFTLWLENAERGTARFQLLGDKNMYRFTLTPGAPQTLRVPFAAAQGKDTLNLFVYWTADGQPHSKYLFVPVKTQDKAPTERQSFALSESSIVEAAREVSARYDVPVTLQDVPHDLRVALSAQQETAVQAIRRSIAEKGLRVSVSRAGVLVAPAPDTASSPVR